MTLMREYGGFKQNDNVLYKGEHVRLVAIYLDATRRVMCHVSSMNMPYCGSTSANVGIEEIQTTKPPQFKVGDKVTVPLRNDQTSIAADLTGDLEGGLVTYAYKGRIEDALYKQKPFIIAEIHQHCGEHGYVLRLGSGKAFSGLLSAEELKLV